MITADELASVRADMAAMALTVSGTVWRRFPARTGAFIQVGNAVGVQVVGIRPGSRLSLAFANAIQNTSAMSQGLALLVGYADSGATMPSVRRADEIRIGLVAYSVKDIVDDRTYGLTIPCYVETPIVTSVVNYPLTDRAYAAVSAQDGGWAKLDTLPTVGLHFRESDIIYNSDDGYYYVFNTEGDGNGPPSGQTYTIASWASNGSTCTLTMSAAHGIAVGTTGIAITLAGTGNSNLDGPQTAAYASATTLTFASSVNASGAGGTALVSLLQVASWTAGGGTGTVILKTPHSVPANGVTRAVIDFSGLTGGTPGNINTINWFCTAPDSVSLTIIIGQNGTSVLSASGTGNAGVGIASRPTNAQIGLRRSTTLAGLATASGADYISRVAKGAIYYPTIVYVNDTTPTWHIFGTTGVNTVSRAIFTGAWPSTFQAFSTSAAVPSLPLGDVHIRRNPADNYWYAVGGNDPDYWRIRVYKSNSSSDITAGWGGQTTQAGTPIGGMGSVWDDIGVPYWAAYAIPDPNLAFVDGRVYLLFTGRSLDTVPNSTAIVELDANTFQAKGVVRILQGGAQYNSWQNGHSLSDCNFVRCPDGVDRIFGFTSADFSGTGQGVWGALELPS